MTATTTVIFSSPDLKSMVMKELTKLYGTTHGLPETIGWYTPVMSSKECEKYGAIYAIAECIPKQPAKLTADTSDRKIELNL
jgi:hypothetical protein